MQPVSWKQLYQICVLLGFEKARQKGSHISMTKAGSRPVIIPKHGKKPLSPVVVRNSMRTLGLTRKEFEELLKSTK